MREMELRVIIVVFIAGMFFLYFLLCCRTHLSLLCMSCCSSVLSLCCREGNSSLCPERYFCRKHFFFIVLHMS